MTHTAPTYWVGGRGDAVTLASFQPDPAWDPTAHAATVSAFEELPLEATIHVWGGDWCGDCQRELPALAAALAAADIDDERIKLHAVTEAKEGELVDAYGVTVVPTVVIELDGEELARFEEEAALSAPAALAETLRDEAGRVR